MREFLTGGAPPSRLWGLAAACVLALGATTGATAAKTGVTLDYYSATVSRDV